MSLSELCIRRPVFATVLSLVVVLIGLVSFQRLSVREYPRIDEPVVTVDTTYPGASAEIIESQVTKTLEDSIAGIEGVDVLTSISRAEQSQITVRFRLEREPDSAAADVRDRVARVRARLPLDIDEPVVAKVEADANPIIWLALNSDKTTPMQLTDLAINVLKPRLQTLPGAADVRIVGDRKAAMRIWLDVEKMAGYGLTAGDVEDALRRQNVEIPSGRIESLRREFSVVSKTSLEEPSEFENIVVKSSAGYPVKIKDLGRVEIAPVSERTLVRFNGKNAVAMGVIKQATANPLDLASTLKARLPQYQEGMPADVKISVGYDSTIFIEKSIASVYQTMIESIVLVALVIFFFLRNFRASLIPLVTIPVSLIGGLSLMYLFGFSINTLTLLAFVLAIGLVVDDAIVVLENIFRHIEDGMEPMAASFKGIKEISFAVIAMTLTLTAVYAPIAFATGRTGRLFIEFALTLAGAVLVSGFVALTLSPMMCSRLLRHEEKHGAVYMAFERGFNRLNHGYDSALAFMLHKRWIAYALAVSVACGAAYLFSGMKRELSPVEDRGVLLAVMLGPDGSSPEFTDKYARQFESIALGLNYSDRLFMLTGSPTVNQAISFIRFVDWNLRPLSTPEIAKQLFPKMSSIPGMLAFPVVPPALGQSPRERPINYVMIGSGTYQEMQGYVQQFQQEVAKNPGLVAVDTDLKLNLPELRLQVDRQRAADMGVSVDAVGRALESMLGGRKVTRFKRNGEEYDVIVQLNAGDRRSPSDISYITVRGKGDALVPLSNLVKSTETVNARELNHFAQRRAVTMTANLAPGYTQGEALDFLDKTAASIFPAGYATDLTGQSREFRNSASSLTLIFGLALLFIYLVLAAQFESFTDPLMILLTVPLSMTGALLALQLTGGSMNVFSQIGLVTLVGLITKHGILLVEFANQLMQEGLDSITAARKSAEMRFRPILMTTGAMVLGAVPLALAKGAGAESRSQIGWVIVGGMTLGTALTLFVLPAIYSRVKQK
ncbi:MAG: efflux RND transporter permease subunit [Burkholderiales bacterium]|nr:efflux RND transporter permease subunit [Burkholderiales bacterium]